MQLVENHGILLLTAHLPLPALCPATRFHQEVPAEIVVLGTTHLPAEKCQDTRPVGDELDLHGVARGYIHRPEPYQGNGETVKHVGAAHKQNHVVPLVERYLFRPGRLSPPIAVAGNAILRPNTAISSGREGNDLGPSYWSGAPQKSPSF